MGMVEMHWVEQGSEILDVFSNLNDSMVLLLSLFIKSFSLFFFFFLILNRNDQKLAKSVNQSKAKASERQLLPCPDSLQGGKAELSHAPMQHR